MKTYTSDLSSIPSWLGTYEGDTGRTLGVDFGFQNNKGMWFSGGANGYTVRTNFDIPAHLTTEVTYTVDHNSFCSDQGICFFNNYVTPNWNWGDNSTRIAVSANCPSVWIYGQRKEVSSGEFGGEGSGVLAEPGFYTFKVKYQPITNSVITEIYLGEDTSGELVGTIMLSEYLEGNFYRVGFDADDDGDGQERSHFKNLTIKIYEDSAISTDETLNNALINLKSNYEAITSGVSDKFYFSDDNDLDDGADPNFDELGIGHVIHIQEDGKILLGGASGLYSSAKCLRRFNTDGTEDIDFLAPLFTYGDPNDSDWGQIRGIAQLSDGIIVVAGFFDTITRLDDSVNSTGLVFLNSDGSIRKTYTGLSDDALVLKALDDDSVLVGGYFNQSEGNDSYYLAKINSDETTDTVFASNVAAVNISGNVHSIAVDSNDKILIGGQFDKKIKRLNSDGTEDSSFDPGSGFSDGQGNNPRVSSIVVQPDGNILVGHWFNSYNGNNVGGGVTRLDGDGALDSSFNPYITSEDGGIVQTLALQSDGKIIVGGWFDHANGNYESKLTRLNSNGSTDVSFATGFGFTPAGWNWGPRVNNVVVDGDGNVFCAGSFTDYNHCARFYYAKIDANGSLLEWSVKPPFRQWGIDDGMEDMYDGANYLNTNYTQYFDDINCSSGGEGGCDLVGYWSIPSTHTQSWDEDPEVDFEDNSDPSGYKYNPTAPDSSVREGNGYFGIGSSYFTTMLPDLFVLAANNVNISEFSVCGNIGSDGSALDAVAKYPIKIGNATYTAFVKYNYGHQVNENNNDPSINHIIIVNQDPSSIEQIYDSSGSRDEHCLKGLDKVTRLFYVCTSKAVAVKLTENETQDLIHKFLCVALASNVSIELRLSADSVNTNPNYRFDGEGNLDTATTIKDGKRVSIQRTGYFEIVNGCDRKVVSVNDGDTVRKEDSILDALSDVIKVLPPVQEAVYSGGLIGTRYVGYFDDNVNWFNTAETHGEANVLTVIDEFSSDSDNYSWQWLGYFKPSTTETYTFYLSSDDASYLWIGDNAISGYTSGNATVNNGGLQGGEEVNNSISLIADTYYPIRIQYGEQTGGDFITVSFSSDTISKTSNGNGYYFNK